MTTRRQEEIVARLRAVRADGQDVFGFREEVILDALDFDHAREFLVADAARSSGTSRPTTKHTPAGT